MLRLYSYWRSSASYRVRIALNLKGLAYETVPVDLVRGGGEQHGAAYRALNPAGLVPLLVDGELAVPQSLAILDYLEQAYPDPPLLPADRAARALAVAVASDVACDIHPLDNLRVLRYLSHELGIEEQRRSAWYHHWIAVGFAALEARLAGSSSPFCAGDRPTWADLCLVPQMYNARRFAVPLEPYPTLVAIAERCEALPAFRAAAPEQQPDAG